MNPFPDTISQYALKLAETFRDPSKWFYPVEDVRITFSDNSEDVYFRIDFKKSFVNSRETKWEVYRISVYDLVNAETNFEDKLYYMVIDNWGVDFD